jgi:hypothetical protein
VRLRPYQPLGAFYRFLLPLVHLLPIHDVDSRYASGLCNLSSRCIVRQPSVFQIATLLGRRAPLKDFLQISKKVMQELSYLLFSLLHEDFESRFSSVSLAQHQ